MFTLPPTAGRSLAFQGSDHLEIPPRRTYFLSCCFEKVENARVTGLVKAMRNTESGFPHSLVSSIEAEPSGVNGSDGSPSKERTYQRAIARFARLLPILASSAPISTKGGLGIISPTAAPFRILGGGFLG
jgi:hypothetical protein